MDAVFRSGFFVNCSLLRSSVLLAGFHRIYIPFFTYIFPAKINKIYDTYVTKQQIPFLYSHICTLILPLCALFKIYIEIVLC